MYLNSAKTVNTILLDRVDPGLEVALRAVIAGAIGYFAWLDASHLPLLIAFGFLVIYTRSAFSSWLTATTYYLVSSADLPVAFTIYFPDDHFLFGYLFWAISGVLLGLPWLFMRWAADLKALARLHDLRFALVAFVGLIFSLLPPFGLIHWVHPGLASGMMFPGWGLWGLLLTFIIISIFPLVVLHLQRGWLFFCILIGAALLFSFNNISYDGKNTLIPNVYAVVADKGEYSNLDGYDRINDVLTTSEEAISLEVPIVLFPEVYVGVMRSSIKVLMSPIEPRMREAGITTLVGADYPVSEGLYDNALIGFGATTGLVYRARLPMPLNALPWVESRQRLHLTDNPVVEVDGKSVFFAICYEAYLLEHAVTAMLFGEKPDMMLASSNLWAIKNLRLTPIMGLSIDMMARIIGIPVKWSHNR